MSAHTLRLIEEYASGGNDALLLAKLEREHHQMLREMTTAQLDKGERNVNIRPYVETQGRINGRSNRQGVALSGHPSC